MSPTALLNGSDQMALRKKVQEGVEHESGIDEVFKTETPGDPQRPRIWWR
jgi:hypothetical protein